MRVRDWLRYGIVVLLLSVVGGHRPLQGAEAAARIKDSEERLKRDITFLASDECEGRGPDHGGRKKAAAYIADQFKKAGLKPGQSRRQLLPAVPIAAARAGWPGAPHSRGCRTTSALIVPGMPISQSAPALSKSGSVSGPLVFAGYGRRTNVSAV